MDLIGIEDGEAVAASGRGGPAAAGCGIEGTLRDLFPPLRPHEREALRLRIVAGEAPRVVVWKGEGVVVDGRDTAGICDEAGIAYETEEREFADLEAVVCWRIGNTLLRRNLTVVAASYYRGKHYQSLKRQGHRSDLTFRQSGERRTDKLLGRLYGVSGRTICRDSDLCEAMDSIVAKGDEVLDPLFDDGFVLHADYRSSVLSGRIRPTRREVVELSRQRLGEMRRAIKDILEGRRKPPRKPVPPAPAPVVPPEPVDGPQAVLTEAGHGDPSGLPAGPGREPPHPGEEAVVAAVPPVVVAGALEARPDRKDGVPGPLAGNSGAEDESAPIDERGLADANRAWGRLDQATQLAFLRQDAVTKRIAEAGFVGLVPAGTGRGMP